ncbi:MAG TPA: hypothetical protein ENH82_00830 [bacterium]|nr:hypothetical protein [bacterium]
MKIIAEIGSNHCGDLDRAIEHIRVAKRMGADMVKFQAWNADEFVSVIRNKEMYETCKKYQVPVAWYKKLSDEGNVFFSVFDKKTLNILERTTDSKIYKIASGDFTNKELIDAVIKTGKEMFISDGGTTKKEQEEVAGYLRSHKVDYKLFYCNACYPPDSTYLLNLHDRYYEGFSDHSDSLITSVMAFVMEVKYYEKHFKTWDNESPDSPISISLWELNRIKTNVDEASKHLKFTERPSEEEKKVIPLIRRGHDGKRPQ